MHSIKGERLYPLELYTKKDESNRASANILESCVLLLFVLPNPSVSTKKVVIFLSSSYFGMLHNQIPLFLIIYISSRILVLWTKIRLPFVQAFTVFPTVNPLALPERTFIKKLFPVLYNPAMATKAIGVLHSIKTSAASSWKMNSPSSETVINGRADIDVAP